LTHTNETKPINHARIILWLTSQLQLAWKGEVILTWKGKGYSWYELCTVEYLVPSQARTQGGVRGFQSNPPLKLMRFINLITCTRLRTYAHALCSRVRI